MISDFKNINNRLIQIDALEIGCWVNVIKPKPEKLDELREKPTLHFQS